MAFEKFACLDEQKKEKTSTETKPLCYIKIV